MEMQENLCYYKTVPSYLTFCLFYIGNFQQGEMIPHNPHTHKNAKQFFCHFKLQVYVLLLFSPLKVPWT